MNTNQRAAKKDISAKRLFARLAAGSAVSVFLYFGFVALYALFALKTGASESLYMPFGVFFGALSGLTGGFVAVKPLMKKGIFYGALSGLASSVIGFVIMFFVNGSRAGSGIFIFAAAMIIGSAAGGVAAINLKIKKKY